MNAAGMTLTITIHWWYWPIVLGVVGGIGFYWILRKADRYDIGMPLLGLAFLALCWGIAIGILVVGSCRL